MRWIRIAIRTGPAALEAVSAALEARGTGGTLFEDGPTAVGYLPADDRFEASLALIRMDLEAMLSAGVDPAPAEITLTFVEDTDWANAWKEHFRPARITGRLTIAPSWSDYAASPDELVIRLDPGMAFGTGGHPSTRLCMHALESTVHSGASVLDVGTGSGVLAIAAALLGAGNVVGIDDDPVAVRVAIENVAVNGLERAIDIREADHIESSDGTLDVVVANILPHVVRQIAPSAHGSLRPGGSYIVSGITLPHEQGVSDALLADGFDLTGRWEEDQWVALRGVKRGAL